jgi:glycosyltransferase involved in cell wall biosynthesis
MSNVKIWDNQKDMRSVYAVTDILLVPSQFIETFGRVIIEAQLNGIPVVAADVGGIPYTLGQGGFLVKPKDKPEVYVDVLQQLRADRNLYEDLSLAAIKNSERPEFNPYQQVDNFIHFVEEHLSP